MGLTFSKRLLAGATAAKRFTPPRLRAPLFRAAWRSYEWYLARRSNQPVAPHDGLPLPPPRLRILVNRTADAHYFLESGAQEAAAIVHLLQRNGRDPIDLGATLDFGCGCGRVARHFARAQGGPFFGCDYNQELVEWCQSNLPGLEVRTNRLTPPLPFQTSFDFIYSISVFTHLSLELQHAWIKECHRALSPGGLLMFTTQGDRYRDLLSNAERAQYDRGEFVSRFDEVEGANLCSAYHPSEFLSKLLAGRFSVVESVLTPVPGVSTKSPLHQQDVHLVERA